MVCDPLGDSAAITRIGRTPEIRCDDPRAGAAGTCPDRQPSGRGDAKTQRETIRQLPSKGIGMTENWKNKPWRASCRSACHCPKAAKTKSNPKTRKPLL